MKEEDLKGDNSHQSILHNLQINYQDQLLLQQMQQQQQHHQIFQEQPSLIPWPSSIPSHHLHQVHNFNESTHFMNPAHEPDPFLIPPPQQQVPAYGGFFNRSSTRSNPYDYYHGDHLRILSDNIGNMGGGAPFGLQAEIGKMTAQEIMDAKALAASKSHSEAERRRRERINNHLAKLRSLLPSTTKTDKASLLAEVIQHVKELKRQTSLIAETGPVPTEIDELTVDNASDDINEDGKFMIKASLCCDDRSDLLPDLIKTLKSLRLRTLKAEITTLGGRVKNVLFVAGDHENHHQEINSNSSSDCCDQYSQPQQYSISSIQEALKAVMEKSNGDNHDQSSSGSVKRQRTSSTNINIP